MDISFLLFLQNFRENLNGIFDKFFLHFSDLSVGYMAIVLPALIYWGISKKAALLMFLSSTINFMVCGFVKAMCAVHRPWMRSTDIHPVAGAIEHAGGYSFPSGHSTGAVSIYGVLSLFGKTWFRISMILIVLLIMFSRMYLGVHTPQDVLVGALISVGGVYVSLKILDYLYKNPQRDILIACIILLCQTLLIYLTYLRANSLAGDVVIDSYKNFQKYIIYSSYQYGFLLAWLLERRFVNFSTEGSVKQRILRILIGFVGLALVLFIGANYLKPLGMCGKFFDNFLIVFYIVFIGPYLIKKSKI
ncbi:MAG: phosphatase PAP2 family protein [Alphaproteobacteria bacterium]|nr:phosphatase PAP2 family protein [Alphaproteobacteria bacterium]